MQTPLREYKTSIRYANCVFRIHLELQPDAMWRLNAHIMSKVPRFGCWSFTRRTTNPSLIVRSILRDIPYYNDDRINEFLRKPVDEMSNLMEKDPDLGPALRAYE